MQECRDADMKNRWDLIWVDTDKSVDPTRKKISIEVVYKRMKQGKIQRALSAFSIVLCNAIVGSCDGACSQS